MLHTLLIEVSNQEFVHNRLENKDKTGYYEQSWHRHSIGEHNEHSRENWGVASFQGEFWVQVGLGLIVLAFTTAAASSEKHFEGRT